MIGVLDVNKLAIDRGNTITAYLAARNASVASRGLLSAKSGVSPSPATSAAAAIYGASAGASGPATEDNKMLMIGVGVVVLAAVGAIAYKKFRKKKK